MLNKYIYIIIYYFEGRDFLLTCYIEYYSKLTYFLMFLL